MSKNKKESALLPVVTVKKSLKSIIQQVRQLCREQMKTVQILFPNLLEPNVLQNSSFSRIQKGTRYGRDVPLDADTRQWPCSNTHTGQFALTGMGSLQLPRDFRSGFAITKLG